MRAIEHRGVQVALHFGPGSTLQIGPLAAQLTQAHWHTPSEHAVRGSRFPLELHYVHVREDGGLAVVAVICETGAPNPQIARLLREAEPLGTGRPHREIDIPAADFAPRTAAHYAYGGSLTTPACDEGVLWHVMQERPPVSPAQIAALSRLTNGDNSRPLQPRNGRRISLVP